jgi:hypothetical protein
VWQAGLTIMKYQSLYTQNQEAAMNAATLKGRP